MTDYNYAVFDLAEAEPDFLTFRNGLHVGERASDHPLEDLHSGQTIAMKSLWSNGPAVIEFGSFT